MATIECMTSITGSKDALVDPLKPQGATWTAFVDKPYISKVWQCKPAYNRFTDPRRNSRAPKILSHQFSNAEYTIWIDGSIQLLRPPQELIDKYLKDYDMAVFGHNRRDCIYDEAKKCAVSLLDDPEVIIEQVSAYEKRGYPKNNGLYECGLLIRRNTAQVREFNNAWWSEWCRHSVRDQISFPYVADQVGLRINTIPMEWRLSPQKDSGLRGNFVKIWPHIIPNPTVR